MTVSTASIGRKAVILSVIVFIGAMFLTSFIYRLDNPNLFVKARMPEQAPSSDSVGPAMGEAMGGAMSKVKEFMARVEANPDDAQALVGLGNSFLMMRAWDRALEPLLKARTLIPEDTTVLKAIGIAYFNKEDYVRAVEAYEAILKTDRTDTLALFNLGVIYKHYFKKPEVAKTYFVKVLKLEKDDSEMIRLAKEELGK